MIAAASPARGSLIRSHRCPFAGIDGHPAQFGFLGRCAVEVHRGAARVWTASTAAKHFKCALLDVCRKLGEMSKVNVVWTSWLDPLFTLLFQVGKALRVSIANKRPF